MEHDPHYSLGSRAYRAMVDNGFSPDLSPEVIGQVHQIELATQVSGGHPSMQDLRSLLWSSIDNDDSRDLDQLEVAEALPNGRIRLMVGIADVDAVVSQNTPIDRHASDNTISVYTGVRTFPMLPEALSHDSTSLIQGTDRAAIVTDMEIDRDGTVQSSKIFPALVHNHARLTYDEVGPWLEGRANAPVGVANTTGMEAQLRLQAQAAERLYSQRVQNGALEFDTVEARPIVTDGQVVDLAVPPKNLARRMIENFMIAANTTMASLLESRGVPSIQRVVRSPQRWPRIVELAVRLGESLPPDPDPRALSTFLAKRKQADPIHFPDLSLSIVKLMGPGEYTVVKSVFEHAGHFGLAVYSYTHSTAPNRRFADVVVQRLLKALNQGVNPPYSEEDLNAIAAHCTERENAARKVERLMRKVVAAALMSDRIGQSFSAIVTGASEKGTYVRLLAPPVEGRVVHGEDGLDVGDRVHVRLIDTDPNRGFIDFACG